MTYKWETQGCKFSPIGQHTIYAEHDLETQMLTALGVDAHGMKVRTIYDEDGNVERFAHMGNRVPHKLIKHYLR